MAPSLQLCIIILLAGNAVKQGSGGYHLDDMGGMLSNVSMNNIIDARGEVCPKPLIMTKKAINDGSITGTFRLLIDNSTSRENVERFLSDNGFTFHTSEEQGTYTITVSKQGKTTIDTDPIVWCPLPQKDQNNTGHVICIRSNVMGSGPAELGEILIKAFINTIGEIESLPAGMVFYNSGVELATKDSPVIESLEKLEERGVNILVCGTCADYLNIKEKIEVGTISNMYEILERLSTATKVVYP